MRKEKQGKKSQDIYFPPLIELYSFEENFKRFLPTTAHTLPFLNCICQRRKACKSGQTTAKLCIVKEMMQFKLAETKTGNTASGKRILKAKQNRNKTQHIKQTHFHSIKARFFPPKSFNKACESLLWVWKTWVIDVFR